MIIRAARDLTAADVYGIWAIRDIVFAVEQRCDEPDVDGVDLRDDCVHLWLEDDGVITSYLRTYLDHGVRKIGRVATRKEHRGQGLSGRLMHAVLDRWGHQELRLGAQAHLEDWYGTFGFSRCGENYREAGIDHVPMSRPGARSLR